MASYAIGARGKGRCTLQTRTVSVASALGASLIAGVVHVAFMYLTAPAFGARLGDFAPTVTSRLGLGTASIPALATGILALLVAAIIWGLVYVPVRNAVPGPDWAVGLGYGFVIWVAGRWLVLPLVGITTAAAGFQTLLAHLLFGLVLAWTARANWFAART